MRKILDKLDNFLWVILGYIAIYIIKIEKWIMGDINEK
jgi:hypothetical protein